MEGEGNLPFFLSGKDDTMNIQVALADRDKQSMLFLGEPLNFTYDTPGPVTVNLDELSPTQKNQLMYNCRIGALAVSDKDALLEACAALPAASPAFTTGHEQPVQKQEPPKDAMRAAEEDLDKLKELLDAHHSTVKKNVVGLRPAQLRSLLELEQSGKKRKSVLKFLEEVVAKHADSVTSQLAEEGDLMDAPRNAVFQADPGARSTQITDVIESDEEEVTLIPSDEELKVADA